MDLPSVSNLRLTGAHCVVNKGTLGPTSQSSLPIVLASFNKGGPIRKAIKPLLHLETDHPLETPVVDDNSGDSIPSPAQADLEN